MLHPVRATPCFSNYCMLSFFDSYCNKYSYGDICGQKLFIEKFQSVHSYIVVRDVKINCYVDSKVLTESSTGSSSSNKVRTMLSIKVEAIDFDTQACVLRVKGRNVEENEYVKVATGTVAFYLTSKLKIFLSKHLVKNP